MRPLSRPLTDPLLNATDKQAAKWNLAGQMFRVVRE